ncbi:type VI secretion system baseplate subunit TssF, partial [Enterobacter roggenkampii]|uniref:type VI secretion system baseplate subunit TssF n=1 Tax=Enterobacter roggenkampii TaxID=1812935 RepID=UPI0022387A89
LPELTEGLVSLLWPHYMRTIPSLAIVEFSPDWRSLRQAETLAEGFSVLSRPVGPHKTACQYRTTHDVPLQPLHIADARLHTETDGRSAIRLRFECPEKVDWSKAGIDKVAIFLNAESPISAALHLAMTRRVHAMYARHAGTHTERHQFDGWCKPTGFDDNDCLWKKADTAFSGYQLLLEYFSFRPKFMFVELRGLDTIGLTEASSWFEIDIVLSEAWSSDLPFETENFRLHCAPVINLFALEADPLTLNPLDNEYLLRPLRLQDGHTEIYSVDNIHGAVKNGKHPYVPFTSFRHRGGMMRHDAPERYFHTRVKRGPSGLYDTWLILGGRSFELEQLLEKPESLSMRITGTNGQLPRKALESTLLDRVVKTGKVPVRVLNVTAPTMPLYPPANDRFHWRVMSHLGSNFLSMMDNPEVLRGTLALYDWTDDEMNRRRLEAIVAVKHTLIRRFEKGFMLRGVDIEVTLDMDNFAGEGDVNLFGEMLHRFFALYADIHLFNQLTLVLQPTGKRLRWRENHSQHVPG